MYLPYLRGRQNELICLRELLDNNLLSNSILPIIEPVRYSSTFFSTLSKFIENDRDVIVIRNPKVGSFNEEQNSFLYKIENSDDINNKLHLQKKTYDNILNDKHILTAYILDNDILNKCLNGSIEVEDTILINTNLDLYREYVQNRNKLNARLTINSENDLDDFICGDKVVLRDNFKKAKRNIDYINKPDEIFSVIHNKNKDMRYKGFSDYSIVGNEYEESGFAPMAVAIHIVYLDNSDILTVHHFVSDSNDSIQDPARKFGEAMDKMMNWIKVNSIERTYGLNKLIEYYDAGNFPGLGVIKKYSIMHHIELIGNYLEGKK